MKPLVSLAVAFSLLSAVPAIAQDSSPATPAVPSSSSSPIQQPEHFPPGLKTVNGSDWRSKDPNIPFSTPVIVHDDFDGNYLAVFDRNYQGSLNWNGHQDGVISNWSRNYIRVYVYTSRIPSCFLICHPVTTTAEARLLEIKVGDRVFRLQGDNGNFPITDELRQALYSAPAGQAKIRITLENAGNTIDSDIGKKTVEAWHVVYAP